MAYIRMLRYAKEEVVSQPTITGKGSRKRVGELEQNLL